jgi:trans-aconitate methyltransferase
MDARNLTFEREFDIAFSNAALHWIIDQKSVLQGVKRSLKPNGRILFQMAGKGNAQAVLTILDEMLKEQKWQCFFDKFTFPYAFLGSEEYRMLLLEAGLEPVRVEIFPRDMKFPGKEGLAGWVRTTWMPFTERIPEGLIDEFISEIISRYLERYPADEEGVVHLSMMRLEIQAKR